MSDTSVRIPIAVWERDARHRSAAPAAELARMDDAELGALRRVLARGLGQLPVGSRPSRLLGSLSRQTRGELRRRERGTLPPAGSWTGR